MRLYTYPCIFGHCCISTTDGLLCGVEIAKTSEEAIMMASLRFAKIGQIMTYEESPYDVVDQVLQAINNNIVDPFIRIHFMNGTYLQQGVWKALRHSTKNGETLTYKDLAKLVGQPTSTRPVASAVGENPIAIIIPCHRVIRQDGKDSGYRWGLQIKKKLLERESLAAINT